MTLQFIQLKDVNTFIKLGTKLHTFISLQKKMSEAGLSYKGWLYSPLLAHGVLFVAE